MFTLPSQKKQNDSINYLSEHLTTSGLTFCQKATSCVCDSNYCFLYVENTKTANHTGAKHVWRSEGLLSQQSRLL